MLKIKFTDSKKEAARSFRAFFLNVCKDICLKLGVVFKQSGYFSKAYTERKYEVSNCRNHAKIKYMVLWFY